MPGVGLTLAGCLSPLPIDLGSAGDFAVLAGGGISNSGPTTLGGDVGSHPTTTQSGFGSVTLTGTNHGGDSAAQAAKADLVAAYEDAALRGPALPIGDLGGLTLTPAVFHNDAAPVLNGTLTLDAEGKSSSLFLFQMGERMTVTPGSVVLLVGSAHACNVFWLVSGPVAVGANASFVGTLMALDGIALAHGANLQGRALARNGAVTLDTVSIERPSCPAHVPFFPGAAGTVLGTFAATAVAWGVLGRATVRRNRGS